MTRASVDERADRFQRRHTGPWQTVDRQVGPIVVTHRYRRRTRIEWVRMAVAGHDLWVHAIRRQLLFPMLTALSTALQRCLDRLNRT